MYITTCLLFSAFNGPALSHFEQNVDGKNEAPMDHYWII